MFGRKLSPFVSVIRLASNPSYLPHHRLSIKLCYDLHSSNKPQLIVIVSLIHHRCDLPPNKRLSPDRYCVILIKFQ
jgi:hypothetical protein